MRINAAKLKSLMNDYGKSHTPFVFGVDYELNNCFFVDNPLSSDEICWQVEEAGNNTSHCEQTAKLPKLEIKQGFTKESYAEKFNVVQAGLLRGDSFLANLTAGVEVDCSVSLEDLFNLCGAKYKLLLPGEFVCFSPECFVKISEDKISTYPMKGTIDAALDDAERTLLDDYKEQCEHNTIVDLLRNDLSMVSDNVRVSRFRYVDRIKTQRGEILQTSSEIVGDLAPDWHSRIGDIIFTLLPAGSICGAPKPATVKLIAMAENCKRGWYTGVFGYYDGDTFDTAVMIRCLAKQNGKLYFHSGGGVTINSRATDEFNEVLQKIYLPIR